MRTTVHNYSCDGDGDDDDDDAWAKKNLCDSQDS